MKENYLQQLLGLHGAGGMHVLNERNRLPGSLTNDLRRMTHT